MFRATFLAAAMALVLSAPAGAATYQVAGKQTAVDANAGTYKMSGGLRGDWAMTSFEEVATEPYYEGKGTEVFDGCIDRRRDRSCKGDPSGSLSFTFRYWALFGSEDPESFRWGACWHPVVEGTGDFAGAQGVLTFVDSPTRKGVKTAYVGYATPAPRLASSCPSDRAVPTEYPADPPARTIASRTTAARPSIPSSPDRLPTLAWTGDPLCLKEVVSRPAPRTREPRRSAVCEALCRTRTGDPFLTMAVPPPLLTVSRLRKPLRSGGSLPRGGA